MDGSPDTKVVKGYDPLPPLSHNITVGGGPLYDLSMLIRREPPTQKQQLGKSEGVWSFSVRRRLQLPSVPGTRLNRKGLTRRPVARLHTNTTQSLPLAPPPSFPPLPSPPLPSLPLSPPSPPQSPPLSLTLSLPSALLPSFPSPPLPSPPLTTQATDHTSLTSPEPRAYTRRRHHNLIP